MSDSSEAQVGLGNVSHPDPFLRGIRIWANIGLLALGDVTSFLIALVVFRLDRPVPQVLFFATEGTLQTPIDIFVLLGLIFIVVRYLVGDYSRRHLFWESAKATTIALLFTSLPCFLLLALLPDQYSAVAEVGSWGFLLFAIPGMRQLARRGMGKIGLWKIPTALIGGSSRSSDIYRALKSTISLGYDVRWFVAENPNCDLNGKMGELKRMPLDDAATVAAKLFSEGCDQAVVATDDTQSPAFTNLIQRLIEAGINVSFSPSFRRLPMTGVTTSYFFGRDILLFQVRSNLRRLPRRFVKRAFDIFASLAAIALLSPLLLLIVALIKLRYPGVPVLFGQKSVGRDGKPFNSWKFSTMLPNAHLILEEVLAKDEALRREWEETCKLKDDPRILPGIGNFLRRTSLNELPQLFNVLFGDMSLVGPRPITHRELIQFYGPAAQLYKSVRPGITGLWQVSGRSETTYDERIVYDEWYILNWSFWYDIVILLQTVRVVLQRRGAY